MSTPLLIISDAPTAGTGLARITRDLATRIHAHIPEFRVACAGYGGQYSSRLGFPQYTIDMDNWQIFNLPDIWQDFAQGERGVVLIIWDASRLLWFSRPHEGCTDPRLKKFLLSNPFEKWTYTPMDATGPHNRLTGILAHTLEGFDRVLAYSAWAEAILRATLTSNSPILDKLTNLPHGIDTSVFLPRNRSVARHGFGQRIGAKNGKGKFLSIPDDAFVVGIVGTNQARKDWGLAIQALAELAKSRKVLAWIHIDIMERAWSLPALLNDYGLKDNALLTVGMSLSDETMSFMYSACDVTLGIGNGEGFGYPIFESLACGTPCIHGRYGGAPEHMDSRMTVMPVGEVRKAMRLDGPYNCQRPVYDPKDWADTIDNLMLEDRHTTLPEHLDWTRLWPRWEQWFKDGLR